MTIKKRVGVYTVGRSVDPLGPGAGLAALRNTGLFTKHVSYLVHVKKLRGGEKKSPAKTRLTSV